MKIDKKNIKHWVYLVRFGLNVMLAIAWRPFRRRGSDKVVVLYGHKLTGNLLAIYKYLQTPDQSGIDAVFLTLDPSYYPELRKESVSCVLATTLQCAHLLSRADAVISDHGLHAMSPMLSLSNVKFFDVWHGIPFKGFDAADFRVQHRYDETWVTSPLLARIYVERYGFDAKKVKVTGYARTDRLVRRNEDVNAIKRRFGLDGTNVGKIVLFAPTWKQDARHRSVFPFGVDEQAFLSALSALAQRTDSTFVMRAHLNSVAAATGEWNRIVKRPHAWFPDTEALLLVSDILVCDWSSIAFDYLLLDRPTIFLDVEPPFAKGLSLDASHRFGTIASDMEDLLQLLQCYLDSSEVYEAEFGEHAAKIRRAVYDDSADGDATMRCVEQLRRQLFP